MSYNKVYENKPIWHNDREPSINEERLNALSNATDIIDNRVIELGDRGVENLPDVSITDLQDGQGIKWNEELQKWENGVVGGIVDITNAEYEYLVEHDLDDRTVTYNITDLNPDGTLIDDSLTESATKTWSINNLSSKFSAINSTLDDLTEITSGTAVKASGVSGTAEYVKIGKTVTAKISIRLSNSIPADTVLVSKFPKNTISAWSPCVSKIDGTTYIGIIDNEGNFKGWSNYPINTDLVACVTYLTSE